MQGNSHRLRAAAAVGAASLATSVALALLAPQGTTLLVAGAGLAAALAGLGYGLARPRTHERDPRAEARHALALETAGLGTVEIDLRTGQGTWSARMAEIAGRSPDQSPSFEDWVAMIHPEDRERALAAQDWALRTGLGDPTEYRIRRPDGSVGHLAVRALVDRAATGEPLRLVAFVQDVTAHREAVEAAQASEERYRTLADTLPQKVWITAPDGTATYMNDAMRAYHGEMGAGLAERLAACHPDDLARVGPIRDGAYARGELFEAELRLRRHDGLYRWHRVTMAPLRQDGPLAGWIGTSLDIDAIKHTEAALREATDLLRLTQEAAGAGSWDWDRRAQVSRLSPRSLHLFGLAEDGSGVMSQEEWFALLHPEDRGGVSAEVERALETRTTFSAEFRVPLPDGGVRWILGLGRCVLDEGGEPSRFVGLNLDVTERRMSDDARRRSEARFRAAAECASDLIWELDLDTGELTWFGDVDHALGYPSGSAPRTIETWAERIHPEDRERVLAALTGEVADGEVVATEHRMLCRDGTVLIWSARGRLVSDGRRVVVGVTTDVTTQREAQTLLERLNQELERRVEEATERLRVEMAERKRAQDGLSRAQKLDAIGRLTGGIAHDLNNKLQVISANITGAVTRLKDRPQLRAGLLSALVAADRSSALIAQLLAFARRQDARMEVVDLEEHLLATGSLLDRSLLGDRVEVRFEIAEDLWPVEVDPSQLEAAIVNLAVNARDAMPEGGVITVEACNLRPWEARHPEVKLAGECVRITVRDTGSGIPPEILPRVFDPFFTTKGLGKGSGLGLSQVYGFAKQLGGVVDINSTLGKGTAVELFLPRASVDARITARGGFDDLIDDVEMPESRGEILVVDDEADVAAALETLLDGLGYGVRVAISPEEALDLLASRRPALVLTDVAMPGEMDGLALAQEIRRRDPTLPVLLITGNPRTIAAEVDFPLIAKPITSLKLGQAIQRELGAGESAQVIALFERGGKRE